MNIGNIDMNGGYLGSEEVIKCYQGNTVVWKKGSPIDYSTIPLTFEILSNGNINWKSNNTGYTKTIEYSKDNGNTWTPITSTIDGTTIPVVSGDTVQFRGNNTQYATNNSNFNSFGYSTATFNAYGNIMSLVDSVNFSSIYSLSKTYVFYRLFINCNTLIETSNLILPATTLTQTCYGEMFRNCTSLTTAPALPATTLTKYCYMQMFDNCTSLTTAPELPATTLTNSCYQSMFTGCTNLNYIKCLATNISANYCTRDWVAGVASTGTFVTPSTTNWSTGRNGIPTNWTRVNSDE